MKSAYITKSPEETMDLGMQLAARLKPGDVVLLFGNLGSGKTHFTKGIAKGLGIKKAIKSPTFAYVNTYEVRSAKYEVQDVNLQTNIEHPAPRTPHLYHYDLYRLQDGGAFNSIGLEDSLNDPEAINIIEWADRLAGYAPKNHIRVDLTAGDDGHQVHIDFNHSEVVPEALVDKYWSDFSTPKHVQNHCLKVAEIALAIANKMVKKGVLLNLKLIETAALLHDMARVCDFRTMKRENFNEPITDEKWEKWMSLRAQYKGRHHGDIAAEVLDEDKFFKTAEVIRWHNYDSILKVPEKFNSLELALVYYADKRAKHDQEVSLDERFADARIRYPDTNKESTAYRLKVEAAVYSLEEKLLGLTI